VSQAKYDELAKVIGAIGAMHEEDQDTTILCLHALNLLKGIGQGSE